LNPEECSFGYEAALDTARVASDSSGWTVCRWNSIEAQSIAERWTPASSGDELKNKMQQADIVS
jgi:hypothetical protein